MPYSPRNIKLRGRRNLPSRPPERVAPIPIGPPHTHWQLGVLPVRCKVEQPPTSGNLTAPPLDRAHGLAKSRMRADAEVPIAAREHVQVPRPPPVLRQQIDKVLHESHATSMAHTPTDRSAVPGGVGPAANLQAGDPTGVMRSRGRDGSCGCSANWTDFRLVVHRHICHEHPGTAAVRERAGRELVRHALHPWGHFHHSLKLGAVLEFGLIVTQIGTAVVIYPLVRRQSETVSLGYVSARTMESVFAAIGLISIMSVVSVADSLASAPGADATALAVQGDSLVNTYDWAFQWGPGLVAGIGNGLMLGYLMYRSALVPPRMAMLGLIGGPLLILSFVLKLCDVYEDGSGLSGLLTLPEAAWELSLGIYCAWKGFRLESPIARPEMATAD